MSELERIGQLYERRGQMSMIRAVRQARLMFYANPLLHGLEPTECRVHPEHLSDLPAGVDGIVVVGDGTVKRGFVLVCCEETSPLTPLPKGEGDKKNLAAEFETMVKAVVGGGYENAG